MERFNNEALSQPERRGEYARYADSIINFISKGNLPIQPVKEILGAPDAERSQGAFMEGRLGEGLGIPQFKLCLDTHHPDFYQIQAAHPWLTIPDPTIQSHLIENGGRTLLHKIPIKN